MTGPTVAYQGQKGAYSSIIAERMFEEFKPMPCRTFEEVFEAVEEGKAQHAVVPIENSITGRIKESMNLLISSDLVIEGEGHLAIKHSLMSKKQIPLSKIKKIYGHPEALSQCSYFLSGLTDTEIISWYDGAGAAEMVKKAPKSALIGSESISEIYSLEILIKNIQNIRENRTRFVVIGKVQKDPSDNDKTSITFKTKHKPGALYHTLEPFAKEEINLTKLESMPSPGHPFEYLFFAEFDGHITNGKIDQVLKDAKEHCMSLKILGSYPKSTNGR